MAAARGRSRINLKKKSGLNLDEDISSSVYISISLGPEIRGEWTSRTSSNLMADQWRIEVSQKDDGRDIVIKLLSPNSSGSMSSKIFLFILGEPRKVSNMTARDASWLMQRALNTNYPGNEQSVKCTSVHHPLVLTPGHRE